ncbi:MAG TPA: acyltransferase [Alloacidobacterium sp.]|nr:acyltransferase [Alloacidobacterium sp.]
MATAEILHADQVKSATEGTKRFYRPELDALRFFAFLAVYVCHSIPNEVVASASARSNGWICLLAAIKDAGNFGVCLFFMLSAFLITELLRRELEAYRYIHVSAFYLRRILRIWPLYFGITIAYALGGRYFPAMRMESGRVFAYFLLAGNWYIALHPWIQTPLRSLWSISVEEQFYLAWPLLAHFGGTRMIAKAAFAIVPFSLTAIMIASADKAYAYNTVWLNSFTQFQFFAWGALLALALNGSMPKPHHAVRGALGVGGVVLWLLSAYATGIKRPGAEVSSVQFCCGYLLVAAGCLLLLLAVLGTSRWRIPGWLVYMGKISFGLYVFHETAFLLVDEAQKHAGGFIPLLVSWSSQHSTIALTINKAIALGATILLAMLSYRFWETPFLRLKRRVTWVQSRSV